ncbi:amidase signature enzyme [Trichodelitschia bisporula]|uniref:Amidase signature enzyme n=1 Tax=Trichodelitschia bisporula TaxID=703511 RepID=A0A6G1I6W7_9PEZI|nr:amidase signature enzyme [Trichodelitschia bisporula]
MLLSGKLSILGAFGLFLASSSAATSLTSTGFTSTVNGISYFSPPKSVGTIKLGKGVSVEAGSYVPVTVVTTSSDKYSASDLSTTLKSFGAKDDVYQDAFSQITYVQYTGGQPKDPKYKGTVLTTKTTAAAAIPNGPYFLSSSGALFKAYRLYSDSIGAFTEGVIVAEDGSGSVLPAGVAGQSVAIAVPSRLYYTATEAKPLAGVRLGVKDIYDLKGLKTSNGNRAWYHFYPEANGTAPPVQNLIDAGAIPVGKMKTSQFANGESATADWVDYHAPFNPRGDGYQQPSSSSSGPGAAAGAYEWLDIALGSDTGGSVRGPSQVQGLFGNRPSHGLVSLDHTMPLSPQLDTPGLLTRDPVLHSKAAKAMYKANLTFVNEYPKDILLVGFPSTATSDSERILLNFVSSLKSFLSGNASVFNITASWLSSRPANAPADLSAFLNLTYPTLITKEQIRLVRDPFYADYAKKYDGRRPFVNPTPLSRWAFGDNTTETVETAVANKTVFMDWFNSKVLAPAPKTCSDKILLYVGSTASPSYRNIYLPPPSVPFGFSSGRYSVLSETPDHVIPIGEASYNSTITNHAEVLPVTVDIMAGKGCDGMIFSLTEALVKAGIIKPTVAGGSSVSGGEILYKRGIVGSEQ